jgi:hypothetical protein
MDDQDRLEVSAGSVAASVGAALLVVLAGLALYVVGTVLVYEGVMRPGRWTGLAAVYLLLALVVPIAIARKMRSSEATWSRTSAVCALVVLVVSIVFVPFATLLMVV